MSEQRQAKSGRSRGSLKLLALTLVAGVGLGVLGLGAVALGPLFGARVVGLGNSPVRLEMAKRIGAHEAFMSDDPDLEAKLDAFTGGVGISLLGRGETPLDFNPLAMEWFYNKGISLIAVNQQAGYLYPTPDDRFGGIRACAHTLSLMAEGGLEPKRLITHRFHYTEMAEAYEMAFRREKSMLGVIFTWQE